MKRRIKFYLAGILILLIAGVIAFQMTSTSFSGRNKFDFGGAQTNASSTNFVQRFIFGNQPVSHYISPVYSGRFGILDDKSSIVITINSPSANAEIVRGGGVSNEDDKGKVSDFAQILAKVYSASDGAGVSNATVYFYLNNVLLGNNETNSSGDSIFSYNKVPFSAGNFNVSVNYSQDDYELTANVSLINFSLIVFNIPNTQGNKGIATTYVWNQTAIFYFNITKTNSSGIFFYDPQNITANATDSAGIDYPEATYVSGYRLYKNAQGQYESRVVLNQTLLAGYTEYIEWKVYISDDNFSNYLGSAVHSDVGIAPTACGNSIVETGETCDMGASNGACPATCSATCTNNSCGTCFVAGTQISMSDNTTKNIEDVRVGDLVKTINIENMQVEYKPVLKINSPIHDDMIVLKFKSRENKVIENKNTFDHPYYVKEKGWASYKPKLTSERYGILSKQLEVGDVVYSLDESDNLVETTLLEIKEEIGAVQTYNLYSVLDNHNFFANGILVHNKECFVAGTQISMSDNTTKNIEDVKVGDLVKTINMNNMQVEYKPVLELSSPIHDDMVVLRFKNRENKIIENKNTFDHPYYVKEKGWASYKPKLTLERYGILSKQLETGDVVYYLDEKNNLVETTLLEIKEEIGTVQTYNLHNVLDNHNYFANGILVHNKESCFPAGVLITMEDGSEKKIEDIKIGDEVKTYDYYNNFSTIAKVMELESPMREGYYNIKLENGEEVNVTDEHPFYAKRKDKTIGWSSIYPEKTKEEVKGHSLEGVEIKELQIGDSLFTQDKQWVKIKTIKSYLGAIQTYNIKHLQTYHTFFANGFLVHNKDGPVCINDCTSGATRKTCVTGSTLKTETCGNYDADSCTEWGGEVFSDCGAGKVCENAQCVQATCVGDSTQTCNVGDCPGTKTRTCTNGEWSEFGVCVKNDLNCGGVCTNGASESCTTDDNCAGTRTCSNNVWGSCIKTNPNCGACTESWSCQWTTCGVGDLFSYPQDCVDANNCGTTKNKPTDPIPCGCIENWKCTWSECKEGDTFSYYTCVDLSNCGTVHNKPIGALPIKCAEREKAMEEEMQKCSSNWKCGTWGECNVKYDFNNVFAGATFADGKSERICSDLSSCKENMTESKPCALTIPIYAKEKVWCSEDYVEIFDKATNSLVGRIKEKEIVAFSDLKRVDISFITSEFTGYCDYCFDGIKNFDEIELDCGGPSCPKCVGKFSFFDWLYWVILISWCIFGFLIIILFWKRRKEEKEKIVRKSLFARLRNWIDSISISKEREKIEEKKIEGWFKRIFRKKEEVKENKFKNWFKKLFKKKVERVARVETREIERAGKIKSLKAELRRRKIANLMKKLRVWKKEGYYGTAEIEEELERLRNQGD